MTSLSLFAGRILPIVVKLQRKANNDIPTELKKERSSDKMHIIPSWQG